MVVQRCVSSSLLLLILLFFFTDHLYNQKCNTVQRIPTKPTEGSVITMEVDLRSDEPAKRTLHWYCDGKDIGGYFFNLPPSVRFGITLCWKNTSIEFISLEKCSSLLKGGRVDGKGWRFEEGDESGQPWD